MLSLTIFKRLNVGAIGSGGLRVVLSLTIFKLKNIITKWHYQFESSAIFNYFQTNAKDIRIALTFESSAIFNYFQTEVAMIHRQL